jgi:hypothetical protein
MTATIDAAAKTENKKLFCMGGLQLICPNSEQRAFWFPEKSGFMKKFPLTHGLAPPIP